MYVRDNDPGVGQTIRTEGRYEPHVTDAVRAVLRPGDTFVDVGASIGYFSCLAGGIVGPTGRVLAFEPGSENVSLLLLNLVRNAIEHARVYPLALGEADGVSLYSTEGSNGTARTGGIDVGALAVGSLVPVARLDDLLPPGLDVRMIKLDVEGSEGLVLRGAVDVIGRCRPTIALEFSPAALPVESGVGSDELLDWLRARGYGVDVLGAEPDVEPAARRGWCDRSNAEVAELFAALGTEHLDLLAWPLDAPVTASASP
jgi:FkbM family methyltransferase